MSIRVANLNYFPLLIASADCCLAALFKVTYPFLGTTGLENHQHGSGEDFS